MKISFCVTCKDRLFHLEQTLPISLISSADYPDREFVILDYNSEDGLHNWAKKNLSYWEKVGVIKYVRTRTPKYFHAAHAKNIAHKNATGDILCNLDCDNFVLNGFCQQLVEVFQKSDVLFCSESEDFFGNSGCCGRIAVKKSDFYSVNGYDETSDAGVGWGWDDVNFRLRVEKHNKLKLVFGNVKYNAVIGHNNYIRTRNFPEKNIEKSREMSIEVIKKIVERNDFIANKGSNWGFTEDLKIGL